MNKVFVLGIDSLSPQLVLKLMREGELPNFQNLLNRSSWGLTQNDPDLSETVWPNFFTAVNPGKHARYFNSQIVPGTYKTKLFHPSEVKANPYWKSISDAGKKVIIVDVPKSYLTSHINGIHIVNWATHDQEIDAGFMTWPPDLKPKLDIKYGKDPVSPNDYGGNGPSDYAEFLEATLKNVERKTRLVLDYIHNREWDHFMVSYDDPHHMAHYAWHLHDSGHPDYDAELARHVGDPVNIVCKAMDKALGKIVQHLDPSTQIMVFLSHGIGPNYHASYILDDILRRFQGVARTRGKPMNKLRAIWRDIPVQFQDSLMPLQNVLRNRLLEPDRRKREAFMLPAADDSGVIRINLVGREPNGIVKPGADFDECCAKIERQMMALRNAETGNPVVKCVLRVSDYCFGDYLGYLPDLIVHWNTTEPIREVYSPETGSIKLPRQNSRMGSHTFEGLVMSSAPGIAAKKLDALISVLDIPPTICKIIGVELPDCDGRPVDELLVSDIKLVETEQ